MEKSFSPSIYSALEQYRNAALGHGKCRMQGDPIATNLFHDEVIKAYREIIKNGNDGIQALLTLINDPNASVRTWASTHCLQFAPRTCQKILETLAAGNDENAFGAMVVLQEWKSGRLKFPLLTSDQWGNANEARTERERLGIHYEGIEPITVTE